MDIAQVTEFIKSITPIVLVLIATGGIANIAAKFWLRRKANSDQDKSDTDKLFRDATEDQLERAGYVWDMLKTQVETQEAKIESVVEDNRKLNACYAKLENEFLTLKKNSTKQICDLETSLELAYEERDIYKSQVSTLQELIGIEQSKVQELTRRVVNLESTLSKIGNWVDRFIKFDDEDQIKLNNIFTDLLNQFERDGT